MEQVKLKHVVVAIQGEFRLSNNAIALIAAAKRREPVVSLGDESRLMGWGNPQDEEEEVVNYWDIPRDDEDLGNVLQKLGPEASLPGTVLRFISIPEEAKFVVEFRDGKEVLLVQDMAGEIDKLATVYTISHTNEALPSK